MKAEVDMSAEAVTRRIKKASELRKLCISLGNAGKSSDAHQSAHNSPGKKLEKNPQ